MDGRFSLEGLPSGAYSIWAQKDSLVSFQRPAFISPTDTLVRDDTLSCPTTVSGTIGVQPQDDPRTVTVQVLGLDKYFNNTDRNGRFTMKNMANGSYSLLLTSTEAHYTPTVAKISIGGCVQTVLPDTLWLTYTGIPTIAGLSAACDTAAGAIRLSWNATEYRNLQAYLIYRDPFDTAIFSTAPVAATADTVFIDTVFNRASAAGPFSASDTNDHHLRYRVAIRSSVNAVGPTFKYADIVAAPPSKVKAVFSFASRHIGRGIITAAPFFSPAGGGVKIAGRASINDSMVIMARITNPTRGLAKLAWRDSAGTTIRDITLDRTQRDAIDSIGCFWTMTGMKLVTCSVVDDAGSTWIDTARIAVTTDIPKIKLVVDDSLPAPGDSSASLIRYALGDTIPLSALASDSFGSIAGIQWGFGRGAASAPKTTALDTFFIAPDTAASRYSIIARVSDDDGNEASDTLAVSLDLFAPATYKAAFKPRMYQSGVVFNDNLWLFGGVAIVQATPKTTLTSLSDCWTSPNGRTWTQLSTNAPARSGHSMVEYNNKLWLIGGYASSWGKYKNDVWCSTDGIAWTCVTDSAAFAPRIYHSSAVFNGKIWVIGGLTRISPVSDAWSSTDGVTWEKAPDTALFTARCCHSSPVFGGRLWVVGGRDSGYKSLNDVWSSPDGAVWTRMKAEADFSPRQGHTCLTFGDRLWIIGGYGFDPSDMARDVWNSADGVAWVHVTDSTCFAPRAFHSGMVFRDRMWIVAGMTDYTTLSNGVWRSGAAIKQQGDDR
jgi:hypothetical protein